MIRENRIRLHRLQRQLGRQGNSASGWLGYGNPFGAGSSLPAVPPWCFQRVHFSLRSLFKADSEISLFHTLPAITRKIASGYTRHDSTLAPQENSPDNISSALLPLPGRRDVIKAMICPRKYFKYLLRDGGYIEVITREVSLWQFSLAITNLTKEKQRCVRTRVLILKYISLCQPTDVNSYFSVFKLFLSRESYSHVIL